MVYFRILALFGGSVAMYIINFKEREETPVDLAGSRNISFSTAGVLQPTRECQRWTPINEDGFGLGCFQRTKGQSKEADSTRGDRATADWTAQQISQPITTEGVWWVRTRLYRVSNHSKRKTTIQDRREGRYCRDLWDRQFPRGNSVVNNRKFERI